MFLICYLSNVKLHEIIEVKVSNLKLIFDVNDFRTNL